MKRVNLGDMTKEKNLDPMLPEYDFKNMPGGVRGKYYKAYRAGHTVKIHQEDGSIDVRGSTIERNSANQKGRVVLGHKKNNSEGGYKIMTQTIYATYDGNVLMPEGKVDLMPNQRYLLRIEVTKNEKPKKKKNILQRLSGRAIDLEISDLAAQHDHYLYGTEKK